jgi:predicted PurR-regulated permease PerM
MNTKIEISIKTVLFTAAFLAALWLLMQIRDILFLLFIAFLLMTAIHPFVTRLERLRIPRIVGILLTYVILISFIAVVLINVAPIFIVQFGKLIQALSSYVSESLPSGAIDVSAVTQQIAPIGESLVKVTIGIFSNIFTFIAIFAFTFYFLLERSHAEEIVTSIVGEAMAKNIIVLLRRIERRLGVWVRGEFVLMSAVGLCSFIGLTILHVDFALPLAIVAGLLELVPMLGPIIASITATLVALSVSPLLALSVVALYIIIQQLENNILVPYIMKKSVGLAPIVTILALMIGARLAGIIGAILAVPIALTMHEVLLFVLAKHADK